MDNTEDYLPAGEQATLNICCSKSTLRNDRTGSASYDVLGSTEKKKRKRARRELLLASSSTMIYQCQLVKWIFLFVYLFIAGVCNWAVIAYTHDFSTRKSLPDILFSFVPEQEWASWVGDYMVSATFACFVVLLGMHQSRAIIARRFMFIAGTLYAFRAVTLLITQLPPGYENNNLRCREQVNFTFNLFISRIVEQGIRAGFQQKTNMLCGDMLFSGHTLGMVTSALSIAYYLPHKWRILQWIPHLMALIGMVCMIISRTHYTIDIFIGYWLSNFIFRVYHAFCEVDIFMERRKSVLYGLWMLWIVEWLEDDIVPGKVENKFELPLDGFLRFFLGSQAVKHHKQISISSASTFNLP